MVFVVFVLFGLCIFWFTDVVAAPLTSSTGSASVGDGVHLQQDAPGVAVLVYRPHGDACVQYNFWYYIVVTNTGSVTLNNVVVTDILPIGIEAASVRTGVGVPFTELPGGTFDGVNTANWEITSLEPQASAWMWIMARTYSWVEGTCMTNRVWVGADEIDPPIQALDVYCVPEGPTADLSATPTSCCAPLSVQFTDLSVAGDNPVVSWAWDFGDGTTSAEQNPSHTYAAGIWTVTLTVTDRHGCEDTRVKTQYIDSNAPPAAQFSAAPTSCCAPLAVQFTDLSAAGDNPLVSWLWDFGDGTTSTEQSPSHTYAAGIWTVTLTVADEHGCTDTEVKTQYIDSNALPAAAFSAAPTSCCAPLSVQFTDLSVAGDNPVVSWAWDFGDGTTSAEQSPSHTYAAGIWTVTLTVTDVHGCTDTEVKTQYIDSNAPPTATFRAVPAGGPAPLAVQFTDLSVAGDNPLISWLWKFGDGATSTNQNPLHEYAAAGAYTATLTVGDAHGCQSATEQAIEVEPPVTGTYWLYLPLIYSPFLSWPTAH
jgi:PKD repeat protein